MAHCPVDKSTIVSFKKAIDDKYNLYKCGECGLVFTYPFQALGNKYFEEEYKPEDYYFRWEFTAMLQNMPKAVKGRSGTVLDIGCGPGTFLISAANQGFDVWGIDFNGAMVRRANAEGLKNIHQMTIEEFRNSFPEMRFDFITCFHIIEHLSDPKGFLLNVGSLLKDDGMLFASVPNPDRFFHKIFATKIADFFPQHVTFWTPVSFSRLFEASGFQPVYASSAPPKRAAQIINYNYDIVYNFFRYFMKLKDKLNNKIIEIAARIVSLAVMPLNYLIFNIIQVQGPCIYCIATKKRESHD